MHAVRAPSGGSSLGKGANSQSANLMEDQKIKVAELVTKAEEAIFSEEKWSKGGCVRPGWLSAVGCKCNGQLCTAS